jgi:hypothetical protein
MAAVLELSIREPVLLNPPGRQSIYRITASLKSNGIAELIEP